MTNSLIVDQTEFDDYCQQIREAGQVAFDTEFVSEYTFRPELCLLQFAIGEECVAVDPYKVEDLTAWWDIMLDESIEVVVHAGREETRFCVARTGSPPANLVDIQIAEGIRSRGYPLSYDRLVARVLGNQGLSKETRTDWRRRPLSNSQIKYALDDVRFVLEIWRRQRDSLSSTNRLHWAEGEFSRMIDDIDSEKDREKWNRLSGVQRLSRRDQAVAREVFRWRESEASTTNIPPKRILRDDLIVDLARRQPKTQSQALATRDMNRPNFKRCLPQILDAIQRALDLPESELPEKRSKHDTNQDDHVLGKLLGIALSNRCAELGVSTTLVGTSSDLRDLVRWHSRGGNAQKPLLAQGWRREVCGDLLTDLLDGKISLRVADAASEHPLVFEPRSDGN